MNTYTKENTMNEILVPPFGYDSSPERVAQLERIIARQAAELDVRRHVAQRERLRADTAEAKLAELREEARR